LACPNGMPKIINALCLQHNFVRFRGLPQLCATFFQASSPAARSALRRESPALEPELDPDWPSDGPACGAGAADATAAPPYPRSACVYAVGDLLFLFAARQAACWLRTLSLFLAYHWRW
jgi:hypothetical protein